MEVLAKPVQSWTITHFCRLQGHFSNGILDAFSKSALPICVFIVKNGLLD
jgi:hypothetical protein